MLIRHSRGFNQLLLRVQTLATGPKISAGFQLVFRARNKLDRFSRILVFPTNLVNRKLE